MRFYRSPAFAILLFIILIISIMVVIQTGTEKIPADSIRRALLSGPEGSDTPIHTIVWKIRLPRIFLGILVGAGLSLAGTALQGVLRNPLSDPYIIGTSSGAALGGVLAIVLNLRESILGIPVISILSFLGSLLTMYAVFKIASTRGFIPVEKFILAGVIIGSFLWAMVSFLLTLAGQNLQEVVFWLMGSTQSATWKNVTLMGGFLISCYIGLRFLAYPLNLLTLGDESAGHLGVNVGKIRLWVIILSVLLTSSTVSVSGMIGFVGLVIPHLCRFITGADHRRLLPISAITGGIFLLWVDCGARILVSPGEIPAGVLTALAGAPFFLYLLKNKKGPV